MENEIKGFMDYLAGEKGASKNTQLSYERDINQLKKYLEEKGITDARSSSVITPSVTAMA